MTCPVVKGINEEMSKDRFCSCAMLQEHNISVCSEKYYKWDRQAVFLAWILLNKIFSNEKQVHPLVAVGIMKVSAARLMPKPHEMSFTSVDGDMWTTIQVLCIAQTMLEFPFSWLSKKEGTWVKDFRKV